MGIRFGFFVALVFSVFASFSARAAGPAPVPTFSAQIISSAESGLYYPMALNNREEWAGFHATGDTHRAVRRTPASVVNYGTLANGGASRFNAISNEKWSAGFAVDAAGVQRAVLAWDGYLEDLSFFQPAGHGASEALGLSDIGHVTGWIQTAEGVKRAFAYFNGHYSVLPPFDESHIGYAIDGVGTVVGTAKQAGGRQRGFFFRQRIYEPEYVPTLGGDSSAVYAMGGFNRVTGEAQTASGDYHAFIYDLPGGGAMIDLGVLPGHKSSKGLSINKDAVVVGQSLEESGRQRGFVYAHGRMWDLNDLIDPRQSLIITSAIAINDSGSILVSGAASGQTVTALLRLNKPLLEEASIDPSSIQFQSERAVSFTASGPIGVRYTIQGSSDFALWEDLLGPSTFSSFPNWHQYTVLDHPDFRFFRVKIVQ